MFQNIIRSVVEALVEYPDQVEVTQVEGSTTLVYELKVAPEDVGKVIGKKGRTINALRTLLKVAAARAKKKVILEVIQYDNSEKLGDAG